MATEQRLIDANARIEEIRKAYCTNCDNYGGVRCRSCWVDDGIGFLEDAPTVDAVEVVRCKDCEHCSHDTMFGDYWCYGQRVFADYFCFNGKRREGE